MNTLKIENVNWSLKALENNVLSLEPWYTKGIRHQDWRFNFQQETQSKFLLEWRFTAVLGLELLSVYNLFIDHFLIKEISN